MKRLWNEWKKGRLTQEEAGRILGMSERTFRRYLRRVEEEGVQGILDKRLTQASTRRAPVDEVLELVEQYRTLPDAGSHANGRITSSVRRAWCRLLCHRSQSER
ncbi:MAG: helix-turn-helix domain-containing protein [Leptospirales bacterium]